MFDKNNTFYTDKKKVTLITFEVFPKVCDLDVRHKSGIWVDSGMESTGSAIFRICPHVDFCPFVEIKWKHSKRESRLRKYFLDTLQSQE